MARVFEELMGGLDEVDAFLAGETAGYEVTLPAQVDVKSIRKRLKMTQSRFSDTFGFSLDAVKHRGGRTAHSGGFGAGFSDGDCEKSECGDLGFAS